MEIINTDNLYLAEFRDCSLENNGIAITNYGYAFLAKLGDVYYNPLNIGDNYPIFEKLPYSNCTKDGYEYGAKIKYVEGEVKDGPCFVICSDPKILKVKDMEFVTIDDLQNVVLESSMFFKDYEDVLVDSKINFIKKMKYINKHIDERNKLDNYLKRDVKLQK